MSGRISVEIRIKTITLKKGTYNLDPTKGEYGSVIINISN